MITQYNLIRIHFVRGVASLKWAGGIRRVFSNYAIEENFMICGKKKMAAKA